VFFDFSFFLDKYESFDFGSKLFSQRRELTELIFNEKKSTVI